MNEYAPEQSEARRNKKKTNQKVAIQSIARASRGRPTHAEVKWEEVRSHNRRKYVFNRFGIRGIRTAVRAHDRLLDRSLSRILLCFLMG